MIHRLLLKRSSRTITAVVNGIGALGLIFIIVFSIHSRNRFAEHVQAGERRIKLLERELVDLDRISDRRILIQEKLSLVQASLRQQESDLPASPRVSELERVIADIAIQSDLQLTEFKRDELQKFKRYSQLCLNVHLEGSVVDLCRALDALSGIDWIIQLRGLEIEQLTGDEKFVARIQLLVLFLDVDVSERDI